MHQFKIKLIYPNDLAQFQKLCNRYFFPINIRQLDRAAEFDARSVMAVSSLMYQECIITCFEDDIENFKKDLEGFNWYEGEVSEICC